MGGVEVYWYDKLQSELYDLKHNRFSNTTVQRVFKEFISFIIITRNGWLSFNCGVCRCSFCCRFLKTKLININILRDRCLRETYKNRTQINLLFFYSHLSSFVRQHPFVLWRIPGEYRFVENVGGNIFDVLQTSIRPRRDRRPGTAGKFVFN